MCVKAGTSTSTCNSGSRGIPTAGANCAGGEASQLPFTEEPISEQDSGLRVFAATQQISAQSWVGSGCQCYELELFAGDAYDPNVACNLNPDGCAGSKAPNYCREDGTGCLAWPKNKTLIVMVTNEGGMGTDTEPFTDKTRTALFDFAVPGGGFGAFNGCSGAWPGVYEESGGPCRASGDTEHCRLYGGFKYVGKNLSKGGPHFCEKMGNAYPEAISACKWLFGASDIFTYNPWPANSDGSIGNPFIQRLRSVTCPKSLRTRTQCPAFDCEKGECIHPRVLLKQAPNPAPTTSMPLDPSSTSSSEQSSTSHQPTTSSQLEANASEQPSESSPETVTATDRPDSLWPFVICANLLGIVMGVVGTIFALWCRPRCSPRFSAVLPEPPEQQRHVGPTLLAGQRLFGQSLQRDAQACTCLPAVMSAWPEARRPATAPTQLCRCDFAPDDMVYEIPRK